MNTTVQALQDLYVKLGGSLTDTYAGIANGAAVGDYVTIPDMIEAVTQKAGSGGGGGGGSASETMLVNFTASGGTYSSDKTLAEISAEWANNKNIIGYNAETGYVLPCVLVNSSVAIFSAVALIAADTFAGMAIQVTSSGVTYEQDTMANKTA